MKEQEIRPSELVDEYLRLAELDARKCFSDQDRRHQACVACDGHEVRFGFTKVGFDYVTCRTCGTLFLNPRPSKESFDSFYRDSESSRYWAEVFFPAVAEVRREKVFGRRVKQIHELLGPSAQAAHHVVDVGAGYGIFLEEWARKWPDSRLVGVEPSSSLADVCRGKGLEVIEAVAEDAVGHDKSADLVTCFEVLEHVHDPLAFVKSLVRFVRPGGLVVVSTLTVDGFDLQVLWEKSTQISPPHHINFLSKIGLERLFQRAGLVDIEISTPGELDVDIVRNALGRRSVTDMSHRILHALAPNDASATGLQDHLRRHRLSSHAWILGRSPVEAVEASRNCT